MKITSDFFKRKKENSKEPSLFPPLNSLAASCWSQSFPIQGQGTWRKQGGFRAGSAVVEDTMSVGPCALGL